MLNLFIISIAVLFGFFGTDRVWAFFVRQNIFTEPGTNVASLTEYQTAVLNSVGKIVPAIGACACIANGLLAGILATLILQLLHF